MQLSAINSQSRDILFDKINLYDGMEIINYEPTNILGSFYSNTNFTKMKNLINDEYSISIYNSFLNTYDNYLADDEGNFTFSRSNAFFNNNKSNFFTTLFLGYYSEAESNLIIQDNYPLTIYEDKASVIRDSFNPHGASSIGQALLGGFFSTLFNSK